MMGVQAAAARFFYDFCLDDHVPAGHQLRGIDRHLDLDDLRNTLEERKETAAAGHAIEFWLFQNGLLTDASGRRLDPNNPDDQALFTKESVGANASKDMEVFFFPAKVGSDGSWPAAYNTEFINYARRLTNLLEIEFIEDLATDLLARGRLERADIEAVADRHGVIY